MITGFNHESTFLILRSDWMATRFRERLSTGNVVNLSNSAICLKVRGDQLLDHSYKQLVQL